MPSTYSTNFRFELIGSGEQQGTWGTTTNTNFGTLIEEAIGGYVTVTVADSALGTTLTANNGTSDQSRNMIINLTGTLTAARDVFCPAIEKLYVVRNATTGGFAVTFRVSGQTGVSIPNGSTYFLYVDGTDARLATGTIASQNANNVSITGGSLSNVSVVANASSLGVRDSDGSHVLSVAAGSNLTANRVFTLTTGDVDRTLNISASNVTVTVAGAALVDDADAAAQRTTLGLGTVATQDANNVAITGGSITGITDLALADGGTGASLSDPNANAILGWNDTANVMRFFTAGTGITINATSNTIAATGPSTANVQTFNSSTTWNKPSGVFSTYRVQIWGGGGSGGKGNSGTGNEPYCGGGGGGYWEWTGPISDLASTETVTVGAGGASVTTTNTGGNTGSTSSFTATNKSLTYTVYGGGGGGLARGGGGGSIAGAGSSASSTVNSQLGTPGGADAGFGGNNSGVSGTPGSTGGGGGGGAAIDSTTNPGSGGGSGWGGAGGGPGGYDSSPGAGAGGTSRYGGNGGAGAFDANNATAGSAPGGGGGGSETGNSGAGGDGRVIVTVW